MTLLFTPTGWFVAFPKVDLSALERLFRHHSKMNPALKQNFEVFSAWD